jgi:hypothetical protein
MPAHGGATHSSLASRVAGTRLSGWNTSHPTLDAIERYDLPQDLKTQLGQRVDVILSKFSAAAEQLKAFGGVREKLTLGYLAEEAANESELFGMSYQAAKLAAGKANEMLFRIHAMARTRVTSGGGR